ncbi:MAG: SMP-30/gluconolactonase/LRE family protein, partial [Actinomycetota bacterium]
MQHQRRVVLDGLGFAEGPRWHDGRLWFSDMATGWVNAVDPEGRVEPIVEVPGRPSGLGWLPDGDLLVVSMAGRRLLRYDGAALHPHAEMGELVAADCNDMVVDGVGRAYVGNAGFDLREQPPQIR